MADWDDSDSDEPQQTAQAAKPTAAQTNWDDSEPSEEEEEAAEAPEAPQSNAPKPKPTAQPTTKQNTNWDESDVSEDDDDQQVTKENGTNTQSQKQKQTAKPKETKKKKPDPKQAEIDAVALEKLRKKMEQNKLKNRHRNKRNTQNKKNQQNKRKPPPKTQVSVPKNQDEIIEMSSSDSSSDDSSSSDNKKPKKKMQTYAERMQTDNDILFGTKKKEEDTRVMLSGEVTLKNFPLGSAKDCEHLADQITGLLDQKVYEDSINTNDVYLFYKKILSSSLLDNLDMVETKQLSTKLNSLLAAKQKAWHIKKNPKGKKKKKPQWIVSEKFNNKVSKKGGYVDGGYDANEFSLFD